MWASDPTPSPSEYVDIDPQVLRQTFPPRTHTHTHTYPPKVVCGDRVLDQRYGNHPKYMHQRLAIVSACRSSTKVWLSILILQTMSFLNVLAIHTLVYEDQKSQPLWLDVHRHYKDRHIMQHTYIRRTRPLILEMLPWHVLISYRSQSRVVLHKNITDFHFVTFGAQIRPGYLLRTVTPQQLGHLISLGELQNNSNWESRSNYLHAKGQRVEFCVSLVRNNSNVLLKRVNLVEEERRS